MALSFAAQLAIGAGVTAGGMLLGDKAKPDIPDPVKPRDFTRRAREFYEGIVAEGDPMRDIRDRNAIDRLLTNSAQELEGPTGASTLAIRKESADNLNEQVSGYLQESDRMEQERQFGAEEKLYQLEAERQMDLDEYEQLKASKEASEEIASANFKAGVFRAGAGLLSTAFETRGLNNDPDTVPDIDNGPSNVQAGNVGYKNQNVANLFSGDVFNPQFIEPGSQGKFVPSYLQNSRDEVTTRNPVNEGLFGFDYQQTYPLFRS